MSNLQASCHLQPDSKEWTNMQGQVFKPRHQAPQGQLIANYGTPL